VLAVVVVLVVVLTGGPDRDTPEGVAQAVADMFDGNDFDVLLELSCPENKELAADSVAEMHGYSIGPGRFEATAEVDEVAMDGDHAAVARILLTYVELPEEYQHLFEAGDREDIRLGIAEQDGEWCVSSFGQ
jgi:hypothetical protein